jgi:phospholipase C
LARKGIYDEHDLPFYYFLADTFAIADHHFPSVRSGTFPDRDYLLLGTSDKVKSTQYTVWPDPSLPSIFDRLDAAGVSWGVQFDVQ